jgi:hypothetical protein
VGHHRGPQRHRPVRGRAAKPTGTARTVRRSLSANFWLSPKRLPERLGLRRGLVLSSPARSTRLLGATSAVAAADHSHSGPPAGAESLHRRRQAKPPKGAEAQATAEGHANEALMRGRSAAWGGLVPLARATLPGHRAWSGTVEGNVSTRPPR